jgi:threonine synthase
MARPTTLICMDCGRQTAFEDSLTCRTCGSEWLEAGYDYARVKAVLQAELPSRKFNLWRYHEVLPIEHAENVVHHDEGGTPLLRAAHFGEELHLRELFIKDERREPTGSFKDRQASVAVARMIERGVRECVLASTGNAATAYAAACARAGIKLWVFVTSLVPPEKMREVALYGAEVVKITGTYDQAKQIAADFAARRRLHFDRGARSLAARSGMKTLAYEIVEQLGWQAPDWYVQTVSGGIGPLGVHRGFVELCDMGLIARVPSIGLVQVDGCSPMAQSFVAGQETATPVTNPQTRIAIISTGNPGRAYTHLVHAIHAHGGTITSVSDQAAFQSMQRLAQSEGLSTEPAAAVAFAGLAQLVKHGVIGADQRVVVNCSGHTFPAEKHIVGEEWGTDVDLTRAAPAPQEGLEAALDHLDERVRTVLIIDDTPNDALLIRRLLETHKSYRVFQAFNGREGIEAVRSKLPDLVILDLMMPEVDGFGVLEAIKSEPRTRHIPVFVVSAKDLSPEDHRRLSGNVEALWQKGSLPAKTFVDRVVQRIEGDDDDLPED